MNAFLICRDMLISTADLDMLGKMFHHLYSFLDIPVTGEVKNILFDAVLTCNI